MFTRIGAAAIKKDLDNTLLLCEHVGNPHLRFKTIHVGGTNGKGSTSHMLAAILQKAGYKTGLYTSPHLKDFRERIRINGKMMSEDAVVEFTEREKEKIEEISPSFFEVTVAMAFDYFASEQVDIAVIEVGLGGRLDSTNVITPELSVITNISLDHTNLLGNTLPEIAFEKAGIIKPGIPVVIGEKQKESAPVFISKAEETSSELVFANTELRLDDVRNEGTQLVVSIYKNNARIYKDLKLDLTGRYQLKNVLTVIQSVILLNRNGFAIPEEAVYSGLADTVTITGLQGRWQTLSRDPLVICDTGHNIAGIQEVLQNIQATPYKKLHIVIGMLKDKDVSSVLQLLPATANYYFCEPVLERALPATELAQQAEKFNLKGKVYDSVPSALEAARNSADPQDLIFVGGSTFVVAEAL
ncbi:bifunctional folylpolyglutamate synthase/dihydrofolate synthase [Pedobacter sp. MC2016-15]|uniref:bifunctional folylpolyglutamate synthase/dihydrofolate synthase n=1 Tax=Pedobacter sp. MC2016-15 TaxID=2994473 RepID=UPI0022461F68|nr:folylpolyglutamate synthase/dihydrofolate synthase family protein [Pedobacter sp. MC2016-15]MCX2479937.1 bifunctional folylpolyglutamate synthase/dihydrofolate synthase [Pedobacter sp. MC2016-15]